MTEQQQHPITPPPELVEQWRHEASGQPPGPDARVIATQAARWGADQELEACREWLHYNYPSVNCEALYAAMRPKPPSLAEQALTALDQADEGLSESEWQQRSDTIRRALERLQELEQGSNGN